MGEYGDVSDEVREYNRRLVERYPWLLPRNVWTDQPLEDYDYEFTNFDDIPAGWRKAFGLNMMEDIRKELIKVNYLEDFHVLQCKEKYGELR